MDSYQIANIESILSRIEQNLEIIASSLTRVALVMEESQESVLELGGLAETITTKLAGEEEG